MTFFNGVFDADLEMLECKMAEFNEIGSRVKVLLMEIEDAEKKMAEIVHSFGPLEEVVVQKNPKLIRLFETLKRVYPEEGRYEDEARNSNE